MRKCMRGRHSYTLACAVSICLASLFARARSPPPPCSLPAWPGEEVVSSWEHHGSRERCFCAYAALAAHAQPGTPRLRELEESCPRWADFVSLDGGHSATMVHASGAFAVALGSTSGNASERKYGYVPDWAADLGSGYGEDCDVSRDPRCEAVGAHVLSLPRRLYVADCCSRPDAARGDATVVAARRPGPQPGPSLADLIASDAASACGLLQDLVAGGLRQVRRLDAFGSCAAENEARHTRAHAPRAGPSPPSCPSSSRSRLLRAAAWLSASTWCPPCGTCTCTPRRARRTSAPPSRTTPGSGPASTPPRRATRPPPLEGTTLACASRAPGPPQAAGGVRAPRRARRTLPTPPKRRTPSVATSQAPPASTLGCVTPAGRLPLHI